MVSRPIAALILLMALPACSSTSFTGTAKSADAEAHPVAKNLSLSCNDQGKAELITELSSDQKTMVKLHGEFCNLREETESPDVDLVFVIDFSGSMSISDPLIGGTCGRLEATRALMAKTLAAENRGAGITYSLISFGDQATQVLRQERRDNFASQLDPSTVCRQDGGATNYEAAFAATETLLTGSSANNRVYFISDGSPSRWGVGYDPLAGGPNTNIGGISSARELYDRAATSGLRAVEKLRSSVNNLTLNALYLRPSILQSDLGGSGGGDEESPEEYLAQLTGDPDLVKVASSAASLAEEIVSFKEPKLLTIDAEEVRGRLEARGFGESIVLIESLTPVDERPGVWQFVTQPFELKSQPGSVTENALTFEVETQDGRQHQATALIDFTLDRS